MPTKAEDTMEVTVAKPKVFDHSRLNEYLRGYYSFVFPHNLFYQWLSYGNVKKDYFSHREFSFTLGDKDDSIYLRYNSFDTQAEMRKAIVARLPLKIDLGAVYNSKPKDSKKNNSLFFNEEERELVFDIDMTDYDDVRSCCQGTGICPKCWPFMIVAARILEGFLREDFGLQNLLWVYSGRRGIHCWVADARARKLQNYAREAIVNFINIFDGGHFKAKKVELNGARGVHPSIARSFRIIDKYFNELMIKQQDFLGTKDQIETIVNLCLDKELSNQLRTYMHDPKLKNSAERWKCLQKQSALFYDQNEKARRGSYYVHQHRYFMEEVMLQMCYPRLDVNVTRGLNHLLKVPFSVHPGTGRVCVPINFAQLEEFDPFAVPTVGELCDELDKLGKEPTGQDQLAGGEGETTSAQGSSRIAERTSLAPSLAVFRAFIKGIEAKQHGALISKSDEKLTF